MANPALFFYTLPLHIEICHLIQLKLSNILIENNCLEKLIYINKLLQQITSNISHLAPIKATLIITIQQDQDRKIGNYLD